MAIHNAGAGFNNPAQEYWDNAPAENRIHLLMNCGWRTHRGAPSPIARKAQRQCWDNLTPAMQRILTTRVQQGDAGI